MQPPLCQLSDRHQIFRFDRLVDKPTDRIVASDHLSQSSSELFHITHTIGVLTTTVEGDIDFTIIHIRDGLDGRGSKVKHNENRG